MGRQPRWQLVGRAARSGDPGRYVVDLLGSDIGPGQLDSLRPPGTGNDGIEIEGFAVFEAVQNGSLLTLRVADFADRRPSPVDAQAAAHLPDRGLA
ncbi:hypothetical protein SSIG_07462 [Streptomyces filamentosus NRRL 11379]|uniref:Predicted protein n=1 Tax=Streptomyces filamentosus NRRL 15998 TaxID=457431 RepID=D6AH77_STRFL|nr:predicted protein [Streptomyces filamentosus NRRL 15998]EWS90139.1 hypothetical protein SSIG_07462 [Streptomyces filamentosus NRRL 11379]